MVIKRIGPMSLARISGILYALVGFVIGCAFSVASVVGGIPQGGPEPPGGMAFGASAVFVLPIAYGFLGFITSLMGAMIYNALAGFIGGIEIEVGESDPNA